MAASAPTASNSINLVFSIVNRATQPLTAIGEAMSGVARQIDSISQRLFFWKEALSTLQGTFGKAYDLFIGQNERLNQSLLAAQSSLAATARITKNSVELSGQAAIQALGDPIREALNNIQKESLKLVGVTSGQLTELTQILLNNATQISNQSQKGLTDPIKAAEKLTISFAAALGTIGLPLNQAGQEMTSLLTAQIDSNSTLAKSLGINNQMVQTWKAQGKLVDEINKRLEPFVAGNALASRSIEGITSNLMEVIELSTRNAGEALLGPLVDNLKVIETFFLENQQNIENALKQAINLILQIGEQVGKLVEVIGPPIASIANSAIKILGAAFESAGQAAVTLTGALAALAPVIRPVLDGLAMLADLLAQALSSEVGKIILQFAAIAAVIVAVGAPLAGLVASVSATIAAVGGLASAIGLIGTTLTTVTIPAFAGMAVAIAPAIPLILAAGAAVGVLAAGIQALRLEDVNTAIEELGKQSEEYSEQALKVATRLKVLNDAEKASGKLTAEQIAEKKKLIAQAQGVSTAIKEQNAAIKSIQPANQEQRDALEGMAAGNERVGQTLDKMSGGITITAKPLERLGTIFEQLQKQITGAETALFDIDKTTGELTAKVYADQQQFEAKAGEYVKSLQQAIESGLMTPEEAIKRLDKIATLTTLSQATQIAAQEALQKARQKIQEKEIQELNRQIQDQEAAGDRGLQSDAKTQANILELRRQSAKEQLANLEENFNATKAIRDRELQLTLNNIEAQITRGEITRAQGDAQAKAARATADAAALEDKRKFGVEQQKLDAELAKAEEAQRQERRKQALKDFDERKTILDSQKEQDKIDNQKAAAEELKIAQDRAKEELKQVQEDRDRLTAEARKQGKTLEEFDKQAAEELATREAESRAKLAKARKQALQESLSDLKEDSEERLALIELASKKGTDKQVIAAQTLAEKTKSLNQQIQKIQQELATATGEYREKLLADEAKLQGELIDARQQALQESLSDLKEDSDERLALIELTAKQGADKQIIAAQTLAEKTKSLNQQIQKVQEELATATGEYREKLLADEAKLQSELIDARQQALQESLSDLKEDSEERLALIELSAKRGTDKQVIAAQTLAEKTKSLNQQIQKVQEELATATGEYREKLLADEARLQGELIDARQQAFEQGLSDLKEDSEERLALIELTAKQGTDKQVIAAQTLAEKTKSLNQQIQKVQEELATATGEYREKLLADEARLQGELIDARQQAYEQGLSDLKEDSEERLALIELASKKGVDKQVIAAQTLAEKTKSLNQQIQKVQQELGTATGEYREKLLADEAKLQGELIDARQQAYEQGISDLKEDLEERLALIELTAKQGTDKQVIAAQTLAKKTKSLNQQIQKVQEELATATGEYREKLLADEARLQGELIDARQQAYEQGLSDLKEDSEERLALIELASKKGVDKQVIAAQTLAEKTKSLNQQIQKVQQELGTATGEYREKLLADEAKLQSELIDARQQAYEQGISDLKEDSEERLALIELTAKQGADKQVIAAQTLAEKEKSLNQQIQKIQQELTTATGEYREKLLADEAKLQGELIDARQQAYEQGLSDLKEDSEERLALIELASKKGVDKQVIAAQTLAEKTKSLNQQIQKVQQELGTATGEYREKLLADEAKLQGELIDARQQAYEQGISDLKEDLEERLALIELTAKQGTDKQVIAAQTLAEKTKSLNQQIQKVQEELATATGEYREKLLADEARLQGELIDARQQAYEQGLSDLKEDLEERRTILQDRLSQGNLTESEFNKTRYQETVESLDRQLAVVRDRRKKISATDIEEQEKLAVEEAQINQARLQAQQDFIDAQAAQLERSQAKARDAIDLSEIDRQKQIQSAINAGVLRQRDAEAQRLNLTRKRTQEELGLEEQKLAFLKSQSALSDPIKEEERQAKIRESQKKTAQLQLQVLEQERQSQEQLAAQIQEKIDRQIQALQNFAQEQTQALELQSQKQGFLSSSLENQNRLLQARQGLMSSINSYVDSEFSILQSSAKSDKERQRIAKQQADFKLKSLQSQQAIERQLLENDIQRTEIAQRRAEIENQIAQIRGQAEIAKSQAELQKVQLDPNATLEAIQAAALAVQAAQQSLAGTTAESQIIAQQRAVSDRENEIKRQSLSYQQAAQSNSAQLESINAIANERRKKLELKQLSGTLQPYEVPALEALRQQDAIAEQNQFIGKPYNPSRGTIASAENAISNLANQPLDLPPPPNLESILEQIAPRLVSSSNPVSNLPLIQRGNEILETIQGQIGTAIAAIEKINAGGPQSVTNTVNNNLSTTTDPKLIALEAERASSRFISGMVAAARGRT